MTLGESDLRAAEICRTWRTRSMYTHGRTWTWKTFQLLPSDASSLASTVAVCRTISSRLGFPGTALKPEALGPQ
ncbi:hypothetical protein FF1_022631 [Malus domestica]